MHRWMMTAAVILVLSPLRLAAQDSSAANVEVTLDEAIRRALDVQPAMVQAEGARRNAGAQRITTLGAFLPTLSVSGAVSKNSQQRFDQNSQKLIPPIPN